VTSFAARARLAPLGLITGLDAVLPQFMPRLVSDLLGTSARRMLQAVADGETNQSGWAALADRRLRATLKQLCDSVRADLHPVYRRLVKLTLDESIANCRHSFYLLLAQCQYRINPRRAPRRNPAGGERHSQQKQRYSGERRGIRGPDFEQQTGEPPR
jgi:hypothetical protein